MRQRLDFFSMNGRFFLQKSCEGQRINAFER